MSLSFLNIFSLFCWLFVVVVWFLSFSFLSKVFSFLTGLSSILGPSGFWHLALPVGVCSLECNNDNNIRTKKCYWLEGDVSPPVLQISFGWSSLIYKSVSMVARADITLPSSEVEEFEAASKSLLEVVYWFDWRMVAVCSPANSSKALETAEIHCCLITGGQALEYLVLTVSVEPLHSLRTLL